MPLELSHPSLVARDTAALENSASPCVVLWDQRSPTLKSAEFSQLVANIRRFFEFEARFGSMEVWRRRPEGMDRSHPCRLTVIAGSLKTHPGTDDRSITIRCPVEGLTPLVVFEDLMYRVTASESCFNIGCGMGLLLSTRMETPAGGRVRGGLETIAGAA